MIAASFGVSLSRVRYHLCRLYEAGLVQRVDGNGAGGGDTYKAAWAPDGSCCWGTDEKPGEG